MTLSLFRERDLHAEIISIGHELLMGEIVDTNTAYLAARLPPLGIQLRWASQVGDDLEHLTEALRRAYNRSDVTFTTGGLGPTKDDLTREGIARALGEEMYVDEALVECLKAWFQSRGFPMPSHNIKQAQLIPSATVMPNPRGTAPGWWVEREGRIIVAMPGPPHELEYMWEHEVRPRLRCLSRGNVILSRTLKTFGLSEAAVDEVLSSLLGKENPYLGIYAKADGIHLRIIARAGSEDAAWDLVAPVEEEVRSLLGPSIWGVDEETLEERVGAMLKERGFTLAAMESCSGGLLASSITDVPGSSAYFLGGIVAYSNEVKIASGVDPRIIEEHGAVSEEAAAAMAAAVRERLKADIGVGITGVAGPDPLEGKPPGQVHIGLAHRGGTHATTGRYPPRRHMVKRRSVMGALLELCRLLQKETY